MKYKKRSLLFIIVAVTLMALLAGCTQTEIKYVLREDGTGSLSGKIAIQQMAYMMMNATLGEISEENASADVLAEMQNALRQSGADVSELKVYSGADNYVGFEFSINLDDALAMELEGDAEGTMNVFDGFSLIKDDNGANILSFEFVDSCEGAMESVYTMMSLNIAGEIINMEGVTQDTQGALVFEQGDKDTILDFDSMSSVDIPCDPVEVRASWKISDTLYEKLIQFPSINGASSLIDFDYADNDDFFWFVDRELHPFMDILGHAQEGALIYLWNEGVMNGTSATTMSPDDFLTREQAVTLIYNAYGQGAGFVDERTLLDVGKERYSYNAIQWALNFGISSGADVDSTGRVTFDPESVLTREQAITMLNNVLIYHQDYNEIAVIVSSLPSPEIVGPSSWAYDAVKNLHSSDVLDLGSGEQDSLYYTSGATRAYFAELLAKALVLYSW